MSVPSSENRMLRSCSYGDVLDGSENTPTPIYIGDTSTADVNNNPGDYVVVKNANGQLCKVKKSTGSPRPPFLPVDTSSPVERFDVEKLKSVYIEKSKEDLIMDLIERDRLVAHQSTELRRLNRLLAKHGASNVIAVGSQSASKATVRHKHPLSRVSPLLGSETDSPRADSPCDSESGIETIISHMSTTVISPKNLENAVDNGAPSTEVGSADSSSGTKQTQDTAATAVRNEVLTDKEDIFMRTAPVNSILTDSNNQDDVTLMSMSGPLPGVPTDSSTSEEKTTNAGNGSQRLMARLSMNAKERRRTRIPVTQRLRNLPKHPPEVNSNDTEEVLVSSKAKHSVPFEWGGADAQHGLLLFMIHDNHMLGATVAGSILGLDSNKTVIVAKRPPPLLFLPGAPPAEYTDRKSGMGVMLEGKDDCGNSLFVLGTIVYSGNLSSIKGADGGNPRGSQCMVIGGLQAIKVRIKDIPTRSRPGNSDIQELDFAALPSDCYIPISDGVALRHFLQKCPSRVDVILDPSSENSWYPYWEGHRKMAPQFRSKGIGYIRLGDDMSMNGNAFLSTDAGETFLDDGGNSVVDSKVPAAPLNRLGSPLGRNTARMRSQNSLDAAIAEEGKFRPHTPGALGSPRGKSSYGGSSALKQIIQNLRQADVPTTTTGIIPANLTWSQRVDLLKRLQKELMLLSNNLATPYTPRTPDATSTSGEWVTDAFSIITDSLIKQKNPNVLKESLACVPLFSPWIPSAASMDVLPNNAPSSASANLLSWRSLFMEVVHCLRHANKSTGECAKAVLNELEKSRAITFRGVARLNPSPFTELLVGPIRGNSGRPAPSSSGSISTAANTARVTNWLTILAANVARESISASQSGGWADDDFYLGDHLTKAVKPLFFHREEATREGAVSLMAMLVCYDAVSTKRTQAPAPRLTESPRARSHSKGMLLDEAQTSSVVSSLPEEVSSTTLQILRDSEEASPKLIAKVVSEALQLIKKFKVEAMSSLNAGKTSGSKISRKPSDISDSNPGNEVLRRNSSGSGSHSVHFDSEKSLDDEWFEAKLTLQKPPCDGASWSELVGIINNAASFFVNISYECKKHSISPGAMIRVLLPFNESTSSSDQANVNNNKTDIDVSSIPYGVIDKYRPYAITLRSTIRVKMADAEDLKQAKKVTEHLKSFCDRAETVANQRGLPVMNILK